MPPDGVLKVQLKASRRLAGLLVGAHAGASILLSAVPLPAVVRVAVLLALALSLWTVLRLHALRSAPRACTGLSVRRDGSVSLDLRSGEVLAGRVLGDSVVNPMLTVINLRRDDNGRRLSIVLLPDSAHGDELRALRVWLRFKLERA